MKYRYYLADLFTDEPFEGIPLPVFPEATGLSEGRMQQIASELGGFGTTFVFPPGEGKPNPTLRLFTPQREVPVAIHAMQAAAFVLASTGRISLDARHTRAVFSHGNQTVECWISHKDGQPTLIQQALVAHAAIDYYTPTNEELAAMLSLTVPDIGFEYYRPLIVSCGAPYLVVPIKSYRAIRAARFNERAWSQSSAPASLAQEILLFSNNTDPNPADFHTRLLGPAIGHQEDPPTTGALPAFASHLCDHPHVREGTLTFAIQHGGKGIRRSLVHVEMDNRRTRDTSLRIGGSGVLVGEGTLEIPD